MKKQKTFIRDTYATQWLYNLSELFDITTAKIRRHQVKGRYVKEDRITVTVTYK